MYTPPNPDSRWMEATVGKEFRQFLLRGNVVDLAVAVVIGAAFGAVVKALVTDFITPLLALVGGQPDFSGLTLTVNETVFPYGHFVNEVVAFVLVSAVIFFFIVKPMNMLLERSRKAPPADPTTKRCGECLSEIPLDARRCAFCAQPVA